MAIKDSRAWQSAQAAFPTEDVISSPILTHLQSEKQKAQHRASSAVEQGMARRGFNLSTYTPAVQAGAAAQAGSPFVGQMAQTQENLRTQNLNSFFKMLGLEMGEEQKRKQREQSGFLGLLGLGLSPFTGGMSSGLGFLGNLLGEQQAGSQASLDAGSMFQNLQNARLGEV